MPAEDTIRRRHTLLSTSPRRPAKSAAYIYEACHLNLPVEPSVRHGRNALVHWAVLLEGVIW